MLFFLSLEQMGGDPVVDLLKNAYGERCTGLFPPDPGPPLLTSDYGEIVDTFGKADCLLNSCVLPKYRLLNK